MRVWSTKTILIVVSTLIIIAVFRSVTSGDSSGWIGPAPDMDSIHTDSRIALKVHDDAINRVLYGIKDEIRSILRPLSRDRKRIGYSNLRVEDRHVFVTIRDPSQTKLAVRRIKHSFLRINVTRDGENISIFLPRYVEQRLRLSELQRAAEIVQKKLSGYEVSPVQVYAHESGCLLVPGVSPEQWKRQPIYTMSKIYIVDHYPTLSPDSDEIPRGLRVMRAAGKYSRGTPADHVAGRRPLLGGILNARGTDENGSAVTRLTVLMIGKFNHAQRAFGEERAVAVIVDGQVIATGSAGPVIRKDAVSGELTLKGDFSLEQANEVARLFRILTTISLAQVDECPDES